MLAARFYSAATVQLLLENGASLYKKTKNNTNRLIPFRTYRNNIQQLLHYAFFPESQFTLTTIWSNVKQYTLMVVSSLNPFRDAEALKQIGDILTSNANPGEIHNTLPRNHSLLLRMYNIPYPVSLVRGNIDLFIAKLDFMKSIVLQKLTRQDTMQDLYFVVMYYRQLLPFQLTMPFLLDKRSLRCAHTLLNANRAVTSSRLTATNAQPRHACTHNQTQLFAKRMRTP